MDETPVVHCELCGEALTGEEHGLYWQVTGWERWRAAGGTNALRGRKQTGAVAHSKCVDALAHGVDPGQGTLV